MMDLRNCIVPYGPFDDRRCVGFGLTSAKWIAKHADVSNQGRMRNGSMVSESENITDDVALELWNVRGLPQTVILHYCYGISLRHIGKGLNISKKRKTCLHIQWYSNR